MTTKDKQQKLTKDEITKKGLSTLDQSRFLALRPSSEIQEAIMANMKAGDTLKVSDFVRVKIPSGGNTRWTIDGISGEESAESITGLLVYQSPRGVLWPSEDPGEEAPVLVTSDFQTAVRMNDNPGDINEQVLDDAKIGEHTYDWQKLCGDNAPYGWGSGKGGVGKRARESRVLCILREADAFPLVINASPGSLATVVPFIKKLPVPHYRAVVELRLEKARSKGKQIEYSQIKPKLVGTISAEEGHMAKQLYTDPLDKVVSFGDYDD